MFVFGPSAEVINWRNINVAILVNGCSTGLSVHWIVDVTDSGYPWLLENWNVLCLVKINCGAVFEVAVAKLLVRLVTHLGNFQNVFTYSVFFPLKVRWAFKELRRRWLLLVESLRLYLGKIRHRLGWSWNTLHRWNFLLRRSLNRICRFPLSNYKVVATTESVFI